MKRIQCVNKYSKWFNNDIIKLDKIKDSSHKIAKDTISPIKERFKQHVYSIRNRTPSPTQPNKIVKKTAFPETNENDLIECLDQMESISGPSSISQSIGLPVSNCSTGHS